MPEGKAEKVRAAMDAWNRGEWDAVFAYTAADLVIDNSTVEGDYRGVHPGREEALEVFRRFTEPWESVRIEITELEVNGDRVFTRSVGHFCGRDGIEVEAHTGMCWTFREERIAHILMPNEVDEARRAAGLPLT